MFNQLKIIFFCFVLIGWGVQIYGGPTQRYLEKHSLEDIIETLAPEYEIERQTLVDLVNTTLNIAENEDDETFFGYHGMSQNNRLFQDILNAVFEEILGVPIPQNFYFLRIPGQEDWNWENGKTTFFDYYNTKPVPQEFKDLILTNFILITNKGLQTPFELSHFSDHEYEIVWSFFEDHLDFLFWNDWINQAGKYAMPQDYIAETPIANKNLSSLIQVIANQAEILQLDLSRQTIEKWFTANFKDYFDTWKVFLLRELPNVDPKKAQVIGNLDLKFDDTSYPQKSQLISLNTTLFGNYVNMGSFSAGIFFENKSILNGDAPLENILKDFFEQLGLEPALASLLWSEGHKILSQYDNNRGCLLQFFDTSTSTGSKPLSRVDQDIYVSFKHGIPLFDIVPSEYIQGHYLLAEGDKKAKDLELRMVANNKTNLNPYSTLRIRRHDGLSGLDPETIPLRMKELLQKHAFRNEEKIHRYQETLENLWEVSLK